jgi:small subunit ribosomal protein S11
MAENTTTTTPVENIAPKASSSKKKTKRVVQAGQVHIKATFNNTLITFTDKQGGSVSSSSAGKMGFRGSKKGTAYAAGVAAEKAAEVAKKDYGMSSVDVFVKGVGLGRDAAIRAVSTQAISINSITDETPIPHGGVRPKGERKP